MRYFGDICNGPTEQLFSAAIDACPLPLPPLPAEKAKHPITKGNIILSVPLELTLSGATFVGR